LSKTAIVVGANGLVGSKLVDVLLADPENRVVHVLVRRPLARTDPRLRPHLIDFAQLAAVDWPAADDVYCCLGTTLGIAGSHEAFRKVDYDYPLAVARGALERGAQQFLFVSAMGADAHSSVFYSQVKGELEAAAAALGFHATIALRPSLLAGDRAQFRLGERVALMVLQPARWLVPRKFRPVAALAVARAMADFAKRGLTGFHVVPSDAIQAFAPG
jgi:uncharacterized protein YbjT (DUF2867 family)